MEKKEMLKIAEKVKFWEEQDRINKELIPRVLKNHDLIMELSSNISKYTKTIIELEQKITKLEKYNKSQNRVDRSPLIISSIALLLSIVGIFI